ncbi:11344_t:CDS:2 [Racocetra fulgida]|uniref:11344_t:CDS:1 n=1 Tax=Racocetra fulgida TaxID=60492 RepID=A0A9N8VET2_9GLOM|nr:11344_t:CDS:2 [Racocetra fulgida]
MPEEETLIIHSDLDELGIPTSGAVNLPIYPVNPKTPFLFSYYLEIYKFSTPELIHQINRTDRVLRALFRKLMKKENRPSWLNSIAEKDLKEAKLQNKIKDAVDFYYAVFNDKENEEFNKEKLEKIISVLNNEDGIFIRGAIPGQCELRKSEEIETFIKQKNQEAVEELIKANNQSESDNEIEQECLRKIIADNLGLKDASKMYILDEDGNPSIFPIYSNSDVFLIAIDINEAQKDIKKRNSFAISDFCISLIEDFEEIFEKIGYYNAEDLLFIEDKLIENNIEKGISYRDYLEKKFGIKGNKIIQFNYNSEYLIENRERFIKGLKKNGQQKEQVLDNYLTNFSEQEQLLNQIEVPFEN